MDDQSISSPLAVPLRQQTSRRSLRQASNSGRRRSPSAKTANTASFISPAPPEVISSLINSLSAISEPVEEHFSGLPRIDDPPERQEATLAASASRQSLRTFEQTAPLSLQQQQQPPQHGWGMDYGAYKRREDIEDEYDSEDDAAPPPPMRMAKASTPVKSRTSSKHSSSSMLAYRTSQTSIGAGKSQPNLRGSGDGQVFGMPSIERMHNDSTPSIASSTETTQNHELRQKRSRDGLRDRVNGINHENEGERPRTGIFSGAAKLLKPIRSKQSLKNDESSPPRNTSPRPGPTWAGRSRSSGLSVSSSVNAGPPRSSHSATSAGALNGHLIPSRRSSLRYSVSESVREDDQRRSSLNLEDMAIDQSLIDQDHSTVKRIRELQEARERRQKEWRKESKKSDRSKRISPSLTRNARRPTSRQSSHMSIAEEASPSDEKSNNLAGFGRVQRGIAEELTSTKHRANASAAIASPPRVSSQPSHPKRARSEPSNRLHKDSLQMTNGNPHVPSKFFGSIEEEVDAFIEAPRLRQSVRHPYTGRLITFSDVGDPNGFAVICCVGMGLTRYLTAFYDELARTLKLRLITPDRPGIGDSEPCPDGRGMPPLNWPDDVELICDHLGIGKFSLLAHSAGVLYALATALRLPQRTRGQLHLLAPWITPSQMTTPGLSKEPSPAANIPFSQKILGILPVSFLKAANASFFGVASASIAKSPKPSAQRRSLVLAREKTPVGGNSSDTSTSSPSKSEAVSCYQATSNALASRGTLTTCSASTNEKNALTAKQYRAGYDAALTPRIWSLATANAQPAIDLIVCLEKYTPIGFLYTDITRAVVIHHGSSDTRVPLDNVRWLANRMKRCELRVLEGEGHGLMASASVMAEILSEIAGEWDEWAKVVKGKKGRRKGVLPGEYNLGIEFEDEEEEGIGGRANGVISEGERELKF